MSSPVQAAISSIQTWSQNPTEPVIHLAGQVLSRVSSLSIPDRLSVIEAVRNLDTETAQPLKASLSNLGKESSCIQMLFTFLGIREPKESRNWKQVVLGVRWVGTICKHLIFLKYTNRADLPLSFEDRNCFFRTAYFSAMIGSSFVTNRPDRIDIEGHLILDALYGAVCLNPAGNFNGFSLALGDGAGGHFGDKTQDLNIGRASHFATKAAVRILSAYNDPATLKEDFPNVLTAIKQEVAYKAKGEGSTLIACRVFPEGERFRIIGFNIGDNLLLAWDPTTSKVVHLAFSCVTEAGTAFMPSTYKSLEVQQIDATLPENSLLFLMSDGIHDSLPHDEKEGIYPNGLTYRMRTLKEEVAPLFQSLNLKPVVKAVMEDINQKRLNTSVQLGDDLSLLACCLSEIPGVRV